MNSNESMLLEAIKNMLSDTAELGLSIHDLKGKREQAHNAQDNYQEIEDKFRVHLSSDPDITLFDLICGAFVQTHSYKSIDSPDFERSFRKQMGATVPPQEKDIAIKYLEKLRKEFTAPVGGRPDKMEHNVATDSAEQAVGLQDQKEMRKASGHEA